MAAGSRREARRGPHSRFSLAPRSPLLAPMAGFSMASSPASAAAPAPKSGFRLSLTQQILLGLALGVIIGWVLNQMPEASRKSWDTWFAVVRDVFLHLIKSMIAPLIFASVVQGFAGAGDIKK